MVTKSEKREKLFILYDGRAKSGDADDATVYITASSVREAWHESRTTYYRYDAIWFEYDVDPKDGMTLINARMRGDIGKGILL